MVEEKANKRGVGLAVVLILCVIFTVVLFVIYSQPTFHSDIDALFNLCIDFFVEVWNTKLVWAILMLVGALVVPLIGIFAITPLDAVLSCIPSGSFLSERVKLCFDYTPGVRFLPGLVTILYFIVASIASGGKKADFDPDSYYPFSQQYCATEWINWVYMLLVTFSLMLVVAEAFVNAGFFGALVHIPIMIAANLYLILLALAIMFVAITILGFLGKLMMFVVVAFASAIALKPQTEKRYVKNS